MTNKIYVANNRSTTLKVIDGSAATTTMVRVGANPASVTLNQAMNKTYVANSGSIALAAGVTLVPAVIDPD